MAVSRPPKYRAATHSAVRSASAWPVWVGFAPPTPLASAEWSATNSRSTFSASPPVSSTVPIAIETTIILQYGLNNVWTFNADRKTGRRAYVYGLLKTNVVRGSAIPLQLAALYALVAFLSLQYLVANAFAIGVTGVYRYVLDSRWTWS